MTEIDRPKRKDEDRFKRMVFESKFMQSKVEGRTDFRCCMEAL